jgi:hypothetical protein
VPPANVQRLADDRRICRLFDSMDICQSVLKSFFVRTAAGQAGSHATP